MSRRGRPPEPLNHMQIKAILAVQDGAPHKVAALDAGYPVNTDFKNEIKRCKERLRKAILCEATRLGMRDKYPDLAIRGSLAERPADRNVELVRIEPGQHAFYDIDERFLVCYERLISQGWHFNEEGKLVGPEKK